MSTRRFVSAGWPYLYDVPALHHCVPMLFGDVMARFYRLRGDEVFFLSGADEHGARVEYVADGLGLTPRALVDRSIAAFKPLTASLELSFDEFGRTDDPSHIAWVKEFFAELRRKDVLVPRLVQVAHCRHCRREQPDAFVEGRCPACNGRAFGNACQDKMVCGKQLRPHELQGPRCAVCAEPIEIVERSHWALPLGGHEILDGLTSSAPFLELVRGTAKRVAGDNPELILTRDFRHGIVVEAPDGRAVCVDGWVDALLAKVSFAERGNKAWFKDAAGERVFFFGGVGLPFYAVVLPALLSAGKRGHALTRWHVQPNPVFVDEGGICSRATGTGIWLAEALASAPPELWRFYVYYAYAARAEERDVSFRWERFAEVANGELIEPLEAAVKQICRHLAAGLPNWRDNSAAVTRARAGAEAALEADRLLAEHRIGRALFKLLAMIKAQIDVADPAQAAAGRDVLRHVLPLLACYLPGVAERAWKRLGLRGSAAARRVAEGSVVDEPAPPAEGPPIFWHGPLKARDAQRDYQKRVEDKRRVRSLEEEITAARADKLCACPSEPSEL